MRTMNVKKLTITQEMIDQCVPGCSVNNPLTIAFKTQIYYDAREIVVNGDEVYVDRRLVRATVPMIRWMIEWHRGKKVKPCILGFIE